MITEGDKVTVNSNMGGVWDCIVEKINSDGMVYLIIDNPQYPDAHGQTIVRPISEIETLH